MANDDSDNDHRPRVVIFGAGVTGLTAAHEFVERGWNVVVVEREIDPLDIDQCSVGGLAKTQWSVYQAQRSLPLPVDASPLVPTARLRLDSRTNVDDFLATTSDNDFANAFDLGSRVYWERVCARLDDITPFVPTLLVSYGSRPVENVDPATSEENQKSNEIAGKIANKIAAQLKNLGAPGVTVKADPSIPVAVLQIETDLRDQPSAVNPADFSTILPGEHGFRFFPALYRHIFDTLRRIPVRSPGENFDDDFRTVFDNLLSTDANWLAITDKMYRPDSDVLNAQDGNNVVKFPRHLSRSLQELFDATDVLQTQLGYTARDIELLKLRFFKYMTSCRARRKYEYESLPWSEFVGLTDLSEVCRRDMQRAPQVLAAMTASESDARTQGNLATQLLLDPINDDDRVDSTLNAPTTVAWFAPWKDYLASQGVVFIPGELVGFKVVGGSVRPDVTAGSSRLPSSIGEGDYYVLALPVQAWSDSYQRLIKSWQQARDGAGGTADDIDRLSQWLTEKVMPEAGGSGKLFKGLSGIQFYFDQDQMRRTGHVLFVDSPWRLSAISQASFWHRRRDAFDGYRGLVSIDIGILKASPADTAEDPKTQWFWQTRRQDVHFRVWDQIKQSYGAFGARDRGPGYRMYHLDEFIKYGFDGPDLMPKNNRAPFLINGVGEWDSRPGWSPRGEPPSAPVETPSAARYQLMPSYGDESLSTQKARWVLAGTFMQTWTRATNMESANESARHAVNTVLADVAVNAVLPDGRAPALGPSELCPIWNPEEYEHPDLQIWQELDERLFEWDEEHLPHVFDILELDALSDELLERGGLSKLVERLTRTADFVGSEGKCP